MQVYFSQDEDTHLDIDLVEHTYRLCINIKEKNKKNELIKKATKRKTQIDKVWEV